mmetsp:Transcript_496/g.502  ORF Transcript_496/g.502 Transcript_496/m.502 type:complete len:138 (-) Transcript_496:246-659(-)
MKLFKGENSDPSAKEKMIDKIKRFYEIHKEMYSKHFIEDPRFEKITETLNRVISIQAISESSILQMMGRIDVLKKRRERREKSLHHIRERTYKDIKMRFRVIEHIKSLKKTSDMDLAKFRALEGFNPFKHNRLRRLQ